MFRVTPVLTLTREITRVIVTGRSAEIQPAQGAWNLSRASEGTRPIFPGGPSFTA